LVRSDRGRFPDVFYKKAATGERRVDNEVALTIGLNSVDPKHYGGWSGELNACEADAEDMADIGQARSFKLKTC
jgi:hypothetical protein